MEPFQATDDYVDTLPGFVAVTIISIEITEAAKPDPPVGANLAFVAAGEVLQTVTPSRSHASSNPPALRPYSLAVTRARP